MNPAQFLGMAFNLMSSEFEYVVPEKMFICRSLSKQTPLASC